MKMPWQWEAALAVFAVWLVLNLIAAIVLLIMWLL